MALSDIRRRASALPGLDPTSYQRHALHGESAQWPEKNCYIDLWIELVHAMGCDPHAMLGHTLPIDFEGDQWTFFKPSHDQLRRLYGIDVQELTIWRPLADHALEHLSAGKLISVEADAWWLPDTAGTDYRSKHTKTTIVLADIDLDAQRLVYFHNAGCFALEGEDFVETFRLNKPEDPAYLPLFAEVVRSDRRIVRPLAELRDAARADLREQFARRPSTNPVQRFADTFERDLPLMRERGLAHYHAWAFAGTRQVGAAAELTARWLAWMSDTPSPAQQRAIEAFDRLSAGAKTFILKGARVVSSSKPADLGALFGGMVQAWDEGMAAIGETLAAG
ncbi:DUF1839 family protein [Ideonella sp.]|uniref:DUF1839 family protein n=1 Tax=Ideonella sp. TaxID=1929293 RepID=UPI0035B20579